MVTRSTDLPPQDLDAERALLGCMMVDPKALAGGVDMIGDRPDAFYRDDHRLIYRALRAARTTGKPVDLVTLRDDLERDGTLKEVGGVDALVSVAESVPSSANWRYYCQIVMRHYLKRNIIRLAERAKESAFNPTLEPDDAAARLTAELNATAVEWAGIIRPPDDREAFARAFEEVDGSPASEDGVPTGLGMLDSVVHLAPGRLAHDQQPRSRRRLQHRAGPQRQVRRAKAAGADFGKQRLERTGAMMGADGHGAAAASGNAGGTDAAARRRRTTRNQIAPSGMDAPNIHGP